MGFNSGFRGLIWVRYGSYSMYHIPPWEANSSSPSQEINPPQRTEHNFSFPWPQTVSMKSILILPTHVLSGFPTGLFPGSLPHQNSASVLCVPLRDSCFFATILDFLVPKTHISRRLCGYNVHKCSLTFTSVIGQFQITVLKMSYKNCNGGTIQDWLHTEKRISCSITWFNKHREATSWKIAIMCWHY